MRDVKLTFFGDSICVGQGVSIFRGWVTRVAERLDSHAAKKGRDVLVSNSSVNGRTTRQALEDMPYQVQGHRPDVLLIQFGLNDCNYWQTDCGVPRVSRAAFKANLQEIVDRATIFGARRIILNNNHPSGKGIQKIPFTEITFEDSNRDYNEAVREVALELGPRVIFKDIEQEFRSRFRSEGTTPSNYLLQDGIHLSDPGHELYFTVMYPTILSVVDELLDEES